MSVSISTIAAIRFGYGFGWDDAPVHNLGDLMAQLSRDDTAVAAFPNATLSKVTSINQQRSAANRLAKQGNDQARAEYERHQKQLVASIANAKRNILARCIFSQDRFRERLVQFWTNHFTVASKNLVLGSFIPNFIDSAIRPNLTKSFTDLLTACTLHPAMLYYLDQNSSVGPNSPVGKRRQRGLNENLARELLELHTLGVDGNYTQTDVRQLAELLTGLRIKGMSQTFFQDTIAEPGSETVLGKTYGGDDPDLDDIKQFLSDVSRRPETARNIARKLVIHFISDDPDPKQIDALAQVFHQTGGDLLQTYAALLDHPNSSQNLGHKVKQPFDFVASGIRALGYRQDFIMDMKPAPFRRNVILPLRLMGQPMFGAKGPDGWPEDADAWITPTGLSGRLQWAMQAAQPMANRLDPRALMNVALREQVSPALAWAVPKAASKQEALAMVLASPEFNRR